MKTSLRRNVCALWGVLVFLNHRLCDAKTYWTWDSGIAETIELLSIEVGSQRPLGFNLNLRPGTDLDGPFVANIQRGSTADRAGLLNGDLIRMVNKIPLAGWEIPRIISLLQRLGKESIVFDISRKPLQRNKGALGGGGGGGEASAARLVRDATPPARCHAVEMVAAAASPPGSGGGDAAAPSYFHGFPCLLAPAGGGGGGNCAAPPRHRWEGAHIVAKVEELGEGVNIFGPASSKDSAFSSLDQFSKALLVFEEHGVALEDYAALGLAAAGADLVLLADDGDRRVLLRDRPSPPASSPGGGGGGGGGGAGGAAAAAAGHNYPPVVVVSNSTGHRIWEAIQPQTGVNLLVSVKIEDEDPTAKKRTSQDRAGTGLRRSAGQQQAPARQKLELDKVQVAYKLESSAAELTFDKGRPGLAMHEDRKHDEEVLKIQVPLQGVMDEIKLDFKAQRARLCPACRGRGARAQDLHACPLCRAEHELGTIEYKHRIGLWTEQSSKVTCPHCEGYGEALRPGAPPCKRCGGRRVTQEVGHLRTAIPRGVPEGHRHVLPGEGSERPKRSRGDLAVQVATLDHEAFRREGSDLVTQINITVTEAFFGFDRNITNLNGTAVLISKRGISRPGSTVRVHTAGLPIFIENPEEYYCYIPSDDDMKVLELWKMNPKDPEYTDGGENRPGFDEYCTKDDLYGDLIIELMILPQYMNEEGTTNNKEDSSSVDGGEEESGLGRDKTPSSAKGGGIKLETE